MGRLIAGETCTLKLICNVEEQAGPVTSITADLSGLGNAAAQNLSKMPDGTWRWTGVVHPVVQGPATIPVTASDNVSSNSEYSAKVRVHVPGKAIAIAAGSSHTLALKADGTVACWGDDAPWKQCCDVPPGLTDVVAIEAGEGEHSFAIKFDGTVVCWGGGSDSYYCPYTEDMTDVVAITRTAVALKADGTVIDRDCDFYGDCDITENLHAVIAIASGFGQRLAAKSDGTVACWGKKDAGECNVPLGLRNVVAVGGGYFHSIALKSDGSVAVWGGDCTKAFNRVVPPGLGKLVAISTQGNVTNFVILGLREDGTVVVWSRPRCGFGAYVGTGYENSIAIASGWYHYVALHEDGSIKTWGDNSYGQCKVPDALKSTDQ